MKRDIVPLNNKIFLS